MLILLKRVGERIVMGKRSFSFTAVAAKAIEDRLRRQEEEISPLTEEQRLDAPNMVQNSGNEEESVGPEAQLPEETLNVNIETPKPRKVLPVKKPNEATSPRPVVGPKVARRPDPDPNPNKTATVKPQPRLPNADDRPKTANKPVEPKALPYGDRYERITTYLEKPLYHRVHDLHQRGEIGKIASLLNAAIREYLDRHYPLR
jgi:outer membrane biosynthesis protein TonB